MAQINQFGGVPGASPGGGRDCLPFEAMLADAIDGTLSADEQARFDDHLATCDQCPGMMADAQRGRALLELLRPEVIEPSPALLDRIFAQTTVLRAKEEETARAERRAAHEAASLLGSRPLASIPASAADRPALGGSLTGAGTGLGKVLPFRERLQTRLRGARHTIFQPRFAMTAAMAFFSIALTLNLSGIRVGQLRLSDLRPGNVKRGVYEARARVVRYYANLRVVYELESRVHDLQRSEEDPGRSNAPAPKPQAQPAPDSTGAPDKGGEGGTAAPASANPGPGKTENPDAAKPRPGIPGQPKSSRNRPNSGTSRCSWPLPGLQEVRFQLSPREGSRPPLVAAQIYNISEPQGKRGLA